MYRDHYQDRKLLPTHNFTSNLHLSFFHVVSAVKILCRYIDLLTIACVSHDLDVKYHVLELYFL